MNLPYRINLLVRLGEYILSNEEPWKQVKEKAGYENGWFIPEFADLATETIARSFLQKKILEDWSANYKLKTTNDKLSTVGIVMAGNIPLVGFHDLLCVFISGHKAMIKLSSKDKLLIKHLTEKLSEWSVRTPPEDAEINNFIQFSEMLKGCDAYIATGSNNSSRYFDYYFGKYPHVIRRNRTSVAILAGEETKEELEKLADDVYLYFGLGCRNVTKIYVPKEYDFIPLLEAFKKYNWLADHHKYKNNYDYNLALHQLNKKYYMTNGSVLLIEDPAFFSPISQLNYEFYVNKDALMEKMTGNPDLQCIVGKGFTAFGKSQSPNINDYADGVDTLRFLCDL
ncbi:MAG TPA: acyl-CoA reductase [Chitinophagaceae bacterium]|nr:acyl-CoA reductase [Chitinophagaceae bacterium]